MTKEQTGHGMWKVKQRCHYRGLPGVALVNLSVVNDETMRIEDGGTKKQASRK
jgi:hypothetical protein